MKCPIDGSDLVMTERQGIEIDYCPKCRGVWLDRGELDKIIDRAASQQAASQQTAPQHPPPHQPAPSFIPPQPQPSAYPQHGHDPRHQHRDHKRKGFLGDLFDIG